MKMPDHYFNNDRFRGDEDWIREQLIEIARYESVTRATQAAINYSHLYHAILEKEDIPINEREGLARRVCNSKLRKSVKIAKNPVIKTNR
jgi:hypothetical protein